MYTQLQLRDSARPPVNVATLRRMKEQGEKIASLTCYDASFAALTDEAGADVVLVGDSLGMVIQGHDSTLPVSMEHMVYHTACVARARGAVAQEPTPGDAPTTLMPRARVADDASAGASARNASAAPGSIGDAVGGLRAK